MFNFDTYLSPYTWRYGSQEMRQVWSEYNKRLIWREIWLNLARAQADFGLFDSAQVADLEAHVQEVDIARSLQIEAEIHHDLMAELKTYAEQCPTGGGILHAGATSMDIEDNAEVLLMQHALEILSARSDELLSIFAEKITEWADVPVMGFTHLQPAEPTTLGYRMAGYAQDLLENAHAIKMSAETLKGKGFKGAVGTGASYAELIGAENLELFEERLSHYLGLNFFPITNQTYPRKQDYDVICLLAGIGLIINKFAFDIRILQTPAYGEVAEPFGKNQVGSSAMPFKRNPVQSEKMNSLARVLAQMPAVAWQNAAQTLLERTLDDSANRRSLIPEAFLVCDELLITAARVLEGLQVDFAAINRDLNIYTPFAGTERLLMALAKAGADRQAMHHRLRSASLTAWEAIQQSHPNPLIDLVASDPVINRYLSEDRIRALFQIETYLGNAPARSLQLAEKINDYLLQEEKLRNG